MEKYVICVIFLLVVVIGRISLGRLQKESSYPLERPESADLALNDLLDRPEPTLDCPESALDRPESALDRLESKRFLGDVLFLL